MQDRTASLPSGYPARTIYQHLRVSCIRVIVVITSLHRDTNLLEMRVEATSTCASFFLHPPVWATVTFQGVFCTIRGGDTASLFERGFDATVGLEFSTDKYTLPSAKAVRLQEEISLSVGSVGREDLWPPLH